MRKLQVGDIENRRATFLDPAEELVGPSCLGESLEKYINFDQQICVQRNKLIIGYAIFPIPPSMFLDLVDLST